MYFEIRAERLARTLRQLALTSTIAVTITAAAAGQARAQWAVIDSSNLANTAQMVTKMSEQIENLKKQLDEAKALNAAVGRAGPLTGNTSAFSMAGNIRQTGQSLFDYGRYQTWLPKDARSPDFNSLAGARDFYQSALTLGTPQTSGAQQTAARPRASADLGTLRDRRRQEADDAALSAMAIAAQTPTSVQQTVTQADALGDKSRASSTEREQLAVLADGMAAIVAQLAKIETQLAALNRLQGAQRMEQTPVTFTSVSDPNAATIQGR